MTGLVKKIDQQLDAVAGKTARVPGVYVIFDGKAPGLETRLHEMAEKAALKHLSLYLGAPPEDYAVATEADVTVVIYRVGKRRGEKVTANFALRNCELDEAKVEAIVRAVSDVLPK